MFGSKGERKRMEDDFARFCDRGAAKEKFINVRKGEETDRGYILLTEHFAIRFAHRFAIAVLLWGWRGKG